MSTGLKYKKKVILPDTVYNDVIVAKFINQIMTNGKKTVAQKIVYGSFDIIKEQIPYIEIPENYDNDGCDFISLNLFNKGMSILINYASYVKKITNKNIAMPSFEFDSTDMVITLTTNNNVILKFIIFNNSSYLYVTYYNNYCYINAIEINISQMLDEIKPFSDVLILLPILISDDVIEDNNDERIVGRLNKNFGFNGYKPILAGTLVYERDNVYYFYGEVEASGIITQIKYNKETLEPCIDKN